MRVRVSARATSPSGFWVVATPQRCEGVTRPAGVSTLAGLRRNGFDAYMTIQQKWLAKRDAEVYEG
jgi:hypothetical protein